MITTFVFTTKTKQNETWNKSNSIEKCSKTWDMKEVPKAFSSWWRPLTCYCEMTEANNKRNENIEYCVRVWVWVCVRGCVCSKLYAHDCGWMWAWSSMMILHGIERERYKQKMFYFFCNFSLNIGLAFSFFLYLVIYFFFFSDPQMTFNSSFSKDSQDKITET